MSIPIDCLARPLLRGFVVRHFAKTTLIAVVVFLFTASSLYAVGTARLRVSANGGANWVTALDFDGDGSLTYNGGIGNNWTLSVSASTKPAIGTADFPEMHLSSLNVSGVGTLIIEFSDIGFEQVDAGNLFKTSLHSGNLGTGTTTVRTYMGYGNVLFQRSTVLGSITQTGQVLEDETVSTTPPDDAVYSLTTRMTIVHHAAGVSTFGATLVDPKGVVAVPEGGSTVSLLGFALLALAGITNWIKRLRRA